LQTNYHDVPFQIQLFFQKLNFVFSLLFGFYFQGLALYMDFSIVPKKEEEVCLPYGMIPYGN
jgi:hypothetical protein